MPDINKVYQWAINTCNAPNVGYSQAYRNQQTVGGITYYDCSSFINYALLAGGFSTPQYAPNSNAFTTYTQAGVLLSLGFTEVPANGEILAGDIGLSSGHTEMCYSAGVGSAIFMGAHTDTYPLADQVSIASFPSSFPRLFRYGAGGAVGYGYSIYVVCALAGNMWVESHINSGQGEIGGGGFGLCQWTGDRRTALESWLTENGYALDSPIGQLEYLLYENDWIQIYGEFANLQEFLNSTSTDIAYLTECFMRCWERPGVPALQDRIDNAMTCYNYILANANNTAITDWVISPTLLPVDDILNNAVMLYRYYSLGGGGGTIGTKKKTLPLYMMLRYH